MTDDAADADAAAPADVDGTASAATRTCTHLVPLSTPCVYYDPTFLTRTEATEAYEELLEGTPWRKTPKINRWVHLIEESAEGDQAGGGAGAGAEAPPPGEGAEADAEAVQSQAADGPPAIDGDSADAASGDGARSGRETNSTGSGYRYRDAPSSASAVGFPEAVLRIKRRAEDWYSDHRRRQRRDAAAARGESGDEKNDDAEGVSKHKPEEEDPSNSEGRVEFNVCLLNFYEDGRQRIGWHSDREEIGRTTPIASVSLGSTRQFQIRAKQDGARDRATLDLANGSLVVMENICQEEYLHCVPKQGEVTGGRINLTFRCKDRNAEGGGHTTAGEVEHERRDNWLRDLSGEGEEAARAASRGWAAAASPPSPTMAPSGSSSSDLVFGDGAHFATVDDVEGEGEPGPSPLVRFVVSTNIGAEGYCAAEVGEVLKDRNWNVVARPFGVAGYVACSGASATEASGGTVSALLGLRTAHHVLEYHDHFDLGEVLLHKEPLPPSSSHRQGEDWRHGSENDDGGDGDPSSDAISDPLVADADAMQSITGEMLYAFYKDRLVRGAVGIASLAKLENGGTFRVTCDRVGGPHGFQGPEVEREVGGAMSEYYDHLRPKMSNFDVNVRVDVIGSKVIVGTQHNVHDLSKARHFLRYRNAVTIKTNLAYAMVRCANIKPGDLLVDPFCGSGTILLEALEYMDKRIRCVGMDVSRRSANGARDNALAENFGPDLCEVHCCDARRFRKHLEDDSVDAIVTNLPWGVMTGHKNVSDLQAMYEIFLRTSWYVLRDGARIVMLVLRGLQLTRIIRKLGGRYRLLGVNVVRTTNNLPSIVVVEKLGVDAVHQSVKRQLSYMAQFVDVSSEMYHAIHYEKIDEASDAAKKIANEEIRALS